jgi:hypothetical protein
LCVILPEIYESASGFLAKNEEFMVQFGSVSDLLVHVINYALAKYGAPRQIGNWQANGERNSEPTKVGGIIVARAVRPSFSTKTRPEPASAGGIMRGEEEYRGNANER